MKTQKKLLTLLSAVGIPLMVLIIAQGLYAFRSEVRTSSNYAAKAKQESHFDNLKVLPKDISKDSLKQLMKNYSLSLGVDCNHCHAISKEDPTELDFASDAKIEKEIARIMIEMTDNLNDTVFKPHYPDPKPDQVHVVDCVMCHRGTVNPEKHLSQMGKMYKEYDPDRDNRKEKAQEEMKNK